MGAHSNYTTVESDEFTVMVILVVFAIVMMIILVAYICEKIKEYKYNRYKKQIPAHREVDPRERAKINFFTFYIGQEIDEALEKEGISIWKK
jgi:hypothetical protein